MSFLLGRKLNKKSSYSLKKIKVKTLNLFIFLGTVLYLSFVLNSGFNVYYSGHNTAASFEQGAIFYYGRYWIFSGLVFW